MRITIQSTNQTTHTRQTFQIFIIINILIFINFAHDVVMFFLSLSLSLCLTKYQRKTKKDVILSNQMNNNSKQQRYSITFHNSIQFNSFVCFQKFCFFSGTEILLLSNLKCMFWFSYVSFVCETNH